MNFEDPKNPELQEKLRHAKSPEELLALVMAPPSATTLSDAAPAASSTTAMRSIGALVAE